MLQSIDFFLPREEYSIEKALYFEVCNSHYNRVDRDSTWTFRSIVDTIFIIIELIPIVGQIIALFESLLAALYYKYWYIPPRSTTVTPLPSARSSGRFFECKNIPEATRELPVGRVVKPEVQRPFTKPVAKKAPLNLPQRAAVAVQMYEAKNEPPLPTEDGFDKGDSPFSRVGQVGGSQQTEFHYRVTIQEEEIVGYTIKVPATENWMTLLRNRDEIEANGKKIEHLPPLQYLAAIFGKLRYHHHFKTIKEATWSIWPIFSQKLYDRLNSASLESGFYEELAKFACFISVSKEPLLEAAKTRNWDAFFDHILVCSKHPN